MRSAWVAPLCAVLGAGCDQGTFVHLLLRGEASPAARRVEMELVLGTERKSAVIDSGGPLALPAEATVSIERGAGLVDATARLVDSFGLELAQATGFATVERGHTASLELTFGGAKPDRAADRLFVTPDARDFGTTIVGTPTPPVTFTVSGGIGGMLSVFVSGDGTQAFEIVDDLCSGQILERQQACTVGVRAVPGAAGGFSAELRVVDGRPYSSASLLVEAVDPGVLAVEPALLSFGAIRVGTASAPASVTLTNAGSGETGPPNLSLTGSDAGVFALGKLGCGAPLAPGASCTFNVSARPGLAGPKTATLVASASPGGTVAIPLTAVCTATVSVTIVRLIHGRGRVDGLGGVPISCGSICEADVSAPSIELEATAEVGDFVAWTVDCTGSDPLCALTMSAARAVRATFLSGF